MADRRAGAAGRTARADGLPLIRFPCVVGLVVAGLTVAGCQGPVAPTNGVVEVANLANRESSFHWQSPGLFGTPLLGGAGTEPIRPCSQYARAFAPGTQRLTISSAATSKSVTLDAPSSGQKLLWLVIEPDGSIVETTEAQVPASPYCGG